MTVKSNKFDPISCSPAQFYTLFDVQVFCKILFDSATEAQHVLIIRYDQLFGRVFAITLLRMTCILLEKCFICIACTRNVSFVLQLQLFSNCNDQAKLIWVGSIDGTDTTLHQNCAETALGSIPIFIVLDRDFSEHQRVRILTCFPYFIWPAPSFIRFLSFSTCLRVAISRSD